MSDLVSRLRHRHGSRDHQFLTWGSLLEEAADEIERLQCENESLRDRIAELLGAITEQAIGAACTCRVVDGELVIDPTKCKASQHCWPDESKD
jgi:hypothetical protein